jgi:hypothetical protein
MSEKQSDINIREALKIVLLEMSRSTDSQEQMAGSWGIIYQHCLSLGMNTSTAETGEQVVINFINDLYRRANNV